MKVWQCLSEVTSLKFVARSANESGWNGAGYGSVVISKPNKKSITFTESGKWQPEGNQPLSFSNVFRWTLDDVSQSIKLEHLRFGPDNPVYLFDLVLKNDSTWQSAMPHICGNDSYSAVMRLMTDKIELHWAIKGTKKNEELLYSYW